MIKILFKIIIQTDRYLGRILIFPVKIYQFLFSFDHSFWAKWVGIRVCVHTPSCSVYTVESLRKFGATRGIILGTLRIIRCNGFTKHRFDPVPDKFINGVFRKKS